MPTKLDITGGKYTHLTAIESRGAQNGGASLWLFRCDCGNEREIALKAVTAGRIKTCGKCKLSSKLRANRGVESGRISSAWQGLYTRALKNARKSGVPWHLTLEEFRSLSTCPCRLCGTPPRTRYRGTSVRYSEVALVSSTSNYTTDNVTALCPECRILKGKFSVSQLITKLFQIYKHLN